MVAPAGPLGAAGGFAWFDDDTTTLDGALGVVDAAIPANIATATVVVASSQGAAVALAAALRPPPRAPLLAVVAFAGFLPDPDLLTLDREPAGDRPAVWLWAGAHDEVVAPVRVRSAARVMERHGLDVTVVEGPGGHAITEDALAGARQWLSTVL